MQNSKRNQKDIKQVKSLLAEMRKAKLKCLQLCEQLNKDLPNLQQYQILEVRCTRTAENLDKIGLIHLQTALAKSLAQLYQAERDFLHEADKSSFKKIAAPPPPRRERQYESKQELGPFRVPTYYNCPQNSLQKIERISNFIESIGRSMDSLRKSMETGGQWDPKVFLQYQPELLTLKRRIEQYRMRDQQLVHAIGKKVEEEIKKLIDQGQQVQEGDEYVMVKIPKAKIDAYGKPKEQPYSQARREQSADRIEQYHSLSMVQPKRNKSLSKKTKLQKINEEGGADASLNQNPAQRPESMDLHITSFQKSNKQQNSRVSKIGENSQMECDQNGNFVYMVKKVSPDSHLNSSIISSISSLRSLRKKVFDDDIWDEFQKL